MSCKKFALIAIACLFLTTAFAAEVKINKVHFLGKGIVINPAEATDFKLLKVIVTTVYIPEVDEDVSVGVFVLDDKKYKARDVTISEDSATGDLYADKTLVGDFAVTKVEKAKTEIWAGSLTIDDVKYYMYVLGAQRDFRAEEVGDKIAEFCQKNPEKCAGADQATCSQNPGQEVCLNVLRQYCAENKDDMRCRNEIIRHCMDKPDAPECKPPSAKCFECMKPTLESCGFDASKCDFSGGMPGPECMPPTPEQEQCIGQVMSKGQTCMTECAEMQGRATTQQTQMGPGYGPMGPNETGGGYGYGPVNSMCRKVMVEQCEAVQVEEPAGPMNCWDAWGKECMYRCAGANGRIDEGCNFKCKMEGKEKCRASEPLQQMGIATNPCTSPYVCMRADNPDVLRQQGYEMASGSMCQQGEFCVKQTGTGGGAGYACPAYYEPVCGMDGKTYPNPCHAKAANIGIKQSGPCEGGPYGPGTGGGYPNYTQPQTYCGNQRCEGPMETMSNCPTDCGGQQPPSGKPLGSPCTYPSDCQSMFCVNGLCSATGANKPLGSQCMNNGECASPYICISGVCSSSGGGGPQSCSDGTPIGACSSQQPNYRCNLLNGGTPQAYTNLVYDSSCAGSTLKPLGAACTYPSDCQSGYCVNNLCSSTGANKPLGSSCMNTGECMTPYVCISGYCASSGSSGGYCGDTICQSTETSSSCPNDCGGGGLKQIGEACTSHPECLSNRCYQGACITPGAIGSACQSGDQCQSYTCTNSVCA